MTVLKVTCVGSVQVPLPRYQTEGAAGLDLHAALGTPEQILPGERRLIPTGLRMQLPQGFEAQVRPRSGLALRFGLTVLNSPGTIDCDFRGEIGIVLINHGQAPVTIEPLMRIAQLIVAPVARVEVQQVDVLEETERASGGYGSTGT